MTGAVQLQAIPASSDRGARALFKVERAVLAAHGFRTGDPVALSAANESGSASGGRALGRIVAGPVAPGMIEVDARSLGVTGADWDSVVTLEPANLAPLSSLILDLDGAVAQPSDLSEHLYDVPVSENDRLPLSLPTGRAVEAVVVSAEPGGEGVCTERTVISIAGRPAKAPGFEGIGGLETQIRKVEEMIVAPMRRPDLFERLGLTPPRGILFTGPPGTGKTLLARAVAARTSAGFYVVNGPEIVSKHYGDSEAALRKVFETAQKAAPAIVFIDELDAIAPKAGGPFRRKAGRAAGRRPIAHPARRASGQGTGGRHGRHQPA